MLWVEWILKLKWKYFDNIYSLIFNFQGHGEVVGAFPSCIWVKGGYPWMSPQLMQWPSRSIWGLVPCSRVPHQYSEGILVPPPATRTPSKFCPHRGLNQKHSAQSPTACHCYSIDSPCSKTLFFNYTWAQAPPLAMQPHITHFELFKTCHSETRSHMVHLSQSSSAPSTTERFTRQQSGGFYSYGDSQ